MCDEFTHDIIRSILLRVCQERGFTSISEAALEIFADCVIDRICEVSRCAVSIASHCGRTDTNAVDVFCALHRYSETTETLASYLSKGDQFPPFEILIDPYPLPRLPRFYPPVSQAGQNQQVFPFRANAIFPVSVPNFNNRVSHIPPFLPLAPSRYTYDRSPLVDTPVEDDAELLKKREGDQERIKKALTTILAGKTEETETSMKYEAELAKMRGGELISMPTELLESPFYRLDGVRSRIDAEFLPMLEVNEDFVIADGNRDVGVMLSILSIRQGTSEPGTLKNASYNPAGTVSTDKSQERVSSPGST
jgi:histone H3/H4